MLINETVNQKFVDINEKLGNAVALLDVEDNVIGRDEELFDLAIITERKETPVPLALGGAGTGKTALICSYMNILKQSGEDVYPFEIDIGAMAESEGKLKVRLSKMMGYMKELKDAILEYNPKAKMYLFIDEVHKVVTTFPRGSKIGGDLLKTSLSRAEDFCVPICATTVKEYAKHISTDEALDRRFKPIFIRELTDDVVMKVLRGWLEKYTKPSYPLSNNVDDSVLKSIIEYNKQYKSDRYEPAKSLDVLISVEAASRVYKRPINNDLVRKIFERQFGLDLNFNIDIDKCIKIIKSRIKGQPIAIDAMISMLIDIKINAAKKEMKPKFVGLFVGPTGVGKTEMAKTIASAVFDSETQIIKMDMSNFSDEFSGVRFRRELGVAAKEKPSSVIVFDELEKAHDNTLNILLTAMDEGILKYEIPGAEQDDETLEANLRNTIMFSTSNAGAKTFNKLNKHADTIFEGDVMTDDYQIAQREISAIIQEALQASELRPEFLNRVEATIPFLGLAQTTMLEIASDEIERSLAEMEMLEGIKAICPEKVNPKLAGIDTEERYSPLALYIVVERLQKKNTDVNGARYIKSLIKREIRGLLHRAAYNNPEYESFEFYTDGNCRWEVIDSAKKKGLLKIAPRNKKVHKRSS